MHRVASMLLLLTTAMAQSDMKLGKCSSAQCASDANPEYEADFDSVSLLQHKAALKIAQNRNSLLDDHSTATSMLGTVKHLAELHVKGEETGIDGETLDKITETMTATVIAGVKVNHEEDQEELNRAVGQITECATVMAASFAANDGVDALKGVKETAMTTMSTCRNAQKGEQEAKDTACDALKAFVAGTLAGKPGCLSSLPDPGPAQQTCLDGVLEWIDPVKVPYEKMKAACKVATENLEARIPTCDLNQGSFETAFCSYGQELTGTCRDYTTCHTSKVADFGTTKTAVTASEDSRKAEFTAAKKVICYVQVLKLSDNKQDKLTECNDLVIDTSEVHITYPEAPGAQGCDTSPFDVKPCDDGLPFYKNEPWFVIAPPKPCTPCAATPATTAAPAAPEYFLAPVSTWQDAETYCVSKGGHLASIHSLQEHEAVVAWMKEHTTSSYPWIGGSTQTCSSVCGNPEEVRSKYQWTDGTPFDYSFTPWSQNDNAPTYVHLYRNGNWGTWCPTCKSQGVCATTTTTPATTTPAAAASWTSVKLSHFCVNSWYSANVWSKGSSKTHGESVESCKNRCVAQTGCVAISYGHNPGDNAKQCVLCDTTGSGYLIPWDYYELS